MASRKKVTESGEMVDEEIPEDAIQAAIEPNPTLTPPPSPSEPKDYKFSLVNGVMLCGACQSTRHTDPVARKDLCAIADPDCPRNK